MRTGTADNRLRADVRASTGACIPGGSRPGKGGSIPTLVKAAGAGLWWKGPAAPLEDELVARYGESVNKQQAARLLGVTRVTVYAMLADGRVKGACDGKRVCTRSIGRYLSSGKRRDAE